MKTGCFNNSLYFTLLATICGPLCGCSLPGQFLGRIDRLEGGLEDMRSVQAELTARVDALEDRARRISGRIEEVEFSQNQQFSGDVDTLKADLSRLQKRLPPPALVPVLALEADETLAATLEPELSRIFTNELTRLRTGNYQVALPGLQSLVASQIPLDIRARALFWTAVCYEGLTDNPKALASYLSLANEFPSHERAPLALFRQASVLIRMRDISTARLTLQKLIAQFPNSLEAKDAQEKLKKLQ
ncbi:MAG: tetratricopeptide repeat protein [Bdellovibrionota bacterium]